MSFEAGFMFAFFGSTPIGATIGTLIGAAASVLNYRVRKNGQSHSSRKMKESKSEGLTNCYTETISSHLQCRVIDKCTGDKKDRSCAKE